MAYPSQPVHHPTTIFMIIASIPEQGRIKIRNIP
jgi:hypothetical protein